MSDTRIEESILRELASRGETDSLRISAALSIAHQEAVGAAKSLEGEGYLVSEIKTVEQWKLSDEAEQIIGSGSPEFQLWELLGAGELEQKAVQAKLGEAVTKIAIGNGMKAKLFRTRKEEVAKPAAAAAAAADGAEKKKKEEGLVFLSRNPDIKDLADAVRESLRALKLGGHVDPTVLGDLKKRKLAAQETLKVFVLRKGPQFSETLRAKAQADITRQMLLDGSWRTATFKPLNFKADGREPSGGQLHPLLKVRQEFREIFLEMGFQEMATQDWVENSFWNFDSLFVPQKHPARDAQDTFFVSKPAKGLPLPEEYLQTVKETHETGYQCDWSKDETERNVLRTHTTAVSSWVLYHLAQSSPLGADGKRAFKPGRYFSIDRVFRNEEMDKTHLCEFHQVEGFIVDRNLSLANMMHTLECFFKRIGVEQLRFKPAFNPYTEPSMEIFGYHTGLKKWMEVGNSGMFRPEMLKPMGFDDDVTAIAWGLSLERPTMIKYACNNIHDLFGHRVDLKFIKNAVIARF